uniref:Uncharacterized protein n=1 Tax=Aureoumbra lagunensis TaxID=44058 RepID=A0A7S3JTQ7_9STRA|mmetsp:Transcript_23612/g.30711  ORF Transcript_23612/g.30711 Transcript_23612/m.30711 type:complete len:201 (+) Transcript_23612:18-620(+)
MSAGPNIEVKTVVVGDTDAGKTSLSERFCYGEAPTAAHPTIGASFLQKVVNIPESPPVVLQLWDTAGQERFRSMAPMYYRGATAAIIVFDVSKENAWNTIQTWQKDLMTYAEPGVVICVAGNKVDLDPAPSFSEEACRASCSSWDATFHLTSATTGQGVDELFTTVARRGATLAAQNQRQMRQQLPKSTGTSSSSSSSCC